jgi:hypothetical protein
MILAVSTQALHSEYLKHFQSTLLGLKKAGKLHIVCFDRRSNYGVVDTVIITTKKL